MVRCVQTYASKKIRGQEQVPGARRASSPARSSVCLGDKAALQYLNILSQRGPASTLKRGGNTPRWLVEHLVVYVDSLNFPIFLKELQHLEAQAGESGLSRDLLSQSWSPFFFVAAKAGAKGQMPTEAHPRDRDNQDKSAPYRTGIKTPKDLYIVQSTNSKRSHLICVGFDMLHGKRSRVVPSQGDVWAVSRTVTSTGGPDQRHC